MSKFRSQQSARRSLQFEKTRGLVGKLDSSGNKVLRDSATGKYWIRPEKSSGNYSTAVLLPLARNATLPARYNLVVEMGYDNTRQLVILGVDFEALKQQGVNPALLNPAETKGVQIEQIKHLYCRHHPTLAYNAYVYPGVAILAGTVVDFTGGYISLLSYQPSAGNHCYAGVYLTDAGALGVSTSTPQSTSTPLVTADLQEVINGMAAGDMPLKAFVLNGDEDDFSDTPLLSKDLRSAWGVL